MYIHLLPIHLYKGHGRFTIRRLSHKQILLLPTIGVLSMSRGNKVDMKLSMSRTGGGSSRSGGGRRSTSSSSRSSCVSSEAEQGSSSPEATSMVLAACPRCLMYVMLAEGDAKCPKCGSQVVLDFLQRDIDSSRKSRKS